MHENSKTPPLFDLIAGLELRDKGIELAAENNASLVVRARHHALRIAREQGEVSMDDVMQALVAEGYGPHCLKNAAGGIFRDRRFQFTGRMVQSKRPWARGNLLRVWRLAR